MSMKSRIMLYTVLPVLAIIIVAGGIITLSVRQVIDGISRSEAAGSTELSCSRVDDVISKWGEIAAERAGSEDISRFLQTASDRDSIIDNAYYSFAMGELDSTVSSDPVLFERTWIASALYQGVAFSNSSDGWEAAPDFEPSAFPFINALNERSGYFITDLYESPISGKTAISAVAPVRDYRTGRIIGFFGADIRLSGLRTVISPLPEMDGNDICIVTSDNTIIYYTDENKMYRSFRNLGIERTDITAVGESFSDGKKEYVGATRSPDSCGWMIYAFRDFTPSKELIDNQTMTTAVTFLCVAAMLIVTLSIVSDRVVKPIQDYTRKINSIQFSEEDRSGEDYLSPEGCRELEHFAVGFNSLLKRNHEIMSQLREMNIKSEKERRLYQTALQSSSDVVFEYDIETDVLITYGSVFDPSIPKTTAYTHEGFVNRILENNGFTAMKPEDTKSFFSGNTEKEAVIARIGENDEKSWISFSGTVVYSDSKPVKIVGKISNIDDVVNLREDASRDRFTGLYNKITTESLIEEKLAEGGSHALFIIDIDNFKSINDILGHEYGDRVIKEIASKISGLLNSSDIAGRIGGDEFMALISGNDASKRSEKLAAALCDSIRHTYSDEENREVSVSSSIGVAMAPEHGMSFKELYSSADIAMYYSKNGGKDRFTFYNGQERKEYKGDRR
ncbi:MAG: sensor domain-containing diguanylate cyclase [Oscillospiraceae bacterium]|nr:sensor domain-containing diguanylate cyclase [Oscillospiraceae bacterium]